MPSFCVGIALVAGLCVSFTSAWLIEHAPPRAYCVASIEDAQGATISRRLDIQPFSVSSEDGRLTLWWLTFNNFSYQTTVATPTVSAPVFITGGEVSSTAFGFEVSFMARECIDASSRWDCVRHSLERRPFRARLRWNPTNRPCP